MTDQPTEFTEPVIAARDDNATQRAFAQRFAHFLTRTATTYAKSPLAVLADRGIVNHTLNALVRHLPTGAIIAGGFMTHVILEEDKANDIDLFFTSKEAFDATVALLQKPPEDAVAYQGYTLKDEVDLANLGDARFVTFIHPKKPALQLIRFAWYESAEHVIDTFDFTIVKFAADNTSLYYDPIAWLDLSRKRLVLARMQFPASTMRRIIKYASKGFYACPGSLAHIAGEIQKFQGPADVNEVVYVD